MDRLRVPARRRAVTASGGIWPTFIGVLVVYSMIAVGLVTVLRIMSRRFDAQDEAVAP
ncbi:MAG: hypothetical protein U0P45_03460 [Acidimicrobiales bacterium]